MESAGSARKRVRVDSESPSTTSEHSTTTDGETRRAEYERDKDFWFQDGSVILVAGGIGFKLYGGVLSSYSPVFKEMLLSLRPFAAALNEDNCTNPSISVIPLNDNPRQLKEVLRVLHPGSMHSAPKYVRTYCRHH